MDHASIPRRPWWLLAFPVWVALGGGWSAGACAPRSTQSQHDHVTETAPGCETCVADLVSCVSTSRGDAQFMECRDLFAACQSKAGLPPATCENPHGENVCAACEERRSICELADPDPASCGADRTECIARLDRDGKTSCAAPPGDVSSGSAGGGCSDCEPGAGGGGAASDGGAGPGCHDPCVAGAAIDAACDPCTAEVCSSNPSCCTSGWDEACVTAAAGISACGCTATTCSHDECAAGSALASTCSSCAAEVCAVDPTCCLVEYTDKCASLAHSIGACGCTSCAHDPCSTGAALGSLCSPCAQAVCTQLSWCCTFSWDQPCEDQAKQLQICSCSGS